MNNEFISTCPTETNIIICFIVLLSNNFAKNFKTIYYKNEDLNTKFKTILKLNIELYCSPVLGGGGYSLQNLYPFLTGWHKNVHIQVLETMYLGTWNRPVNTAATMHHVKSPETQESEPE